MKWLQIDRQYRFAWIGKILITWDIDEYSISYYPDYENCKYRLGGLSK